MTMFSRLSRSESTASRTVESTTNSATHITRTVASPIEEVRRDTSESDYKDGTTSLYGTHANRHRTRRADPFQEPQRPRLADIEVQSSFGLPHLHPRPSPPPVKISPALPSRVFKFKPGKDTYWRNTPDEPPTMIIPAKYTCKLNFPSILEQDDGNPEKKGHNLRDRTVTEVENYEAVDGFPYYHVRQGPCTYVTKENLYCESTAYKFFQCIHYVEEELKNHQGLPRDIIACLQIQDTQPDDQQTAWSYYFVSHDESNPCVFWLEDFRHPYGYRSPVQLRFSLLMEYWTHCGQFPQLMPTHNMKKDIEDIIATLMQLLVERTTAKPRAPFPRDDLRNLIDMMTLASQSCLEDDPNRAPHHHMVSAIARINVVLMGWRFHTHVKKDTPKRSWLFVLCSTLLFYAPERHLEELQRANPADFVFEGSWAQFIAEWEKPWNDFILYATVLLAVNLSYLAVPTVIPSGDQPGIIGSLSSATLAASTGVLASLCSIIMSIGCIILGLLLVNEHHSDPKTEDEPIEYLMKFYGRKFGYQQLAVLYALPYALLIWSMIAFLIAVAFFCIDSNTVQQVVTASVGAIIFTLILWEVQVHWKSDYEITKPFLSKKHLPAF